MAIIEDETLLAFTEEALEHLDGIEADLLSIEENGADIDADVVNKVFRAVHSIKGGAGFLGLEKVKDLSHHGENILNMIRNEELVPTPGIVSVLLASTDLLTSMISDAVNSNEVDITNYVNDLKNVLEDSVDEEDKPSLESSLNIGTADQENMFSVNTFEYETAIKQGKNIFIIEYDLITDIEAKGKNPLEVINELQQTGEIFDSLIDVDSVGGLDSAPSSPMRLPFFILFGTIMEVELLRGFIDLPIEKVTEPIIYEANAASTTTATPSENPYVQDVAESSLTDIPEAEFAQTLTNTPEPVAAIRQIDQAPSTPTKKKTKSAPPAAKPFKAESNLRVNVKILDNLMTLAGELVLTRNQLIQAVSSNNPQGVDTVSQRLDLVTSELQESIMSTRMQPIGNIFNKFKRVVRDLTRDLGKNIDLLIEGEDVDLDKTIIEAIGDPLTHLVRNSIDHGIETPDSRTNKGKNPTGTLKLSAFHEGGQVIIKITDDGAGINTDRLKEKSLKMGTHDAAQLEAMSQRELAKLIFTPGLSTAQEVSDISGRGVGMDVVFTNLSKLGGVIDVDTETDLGTTITIKLPLTLAIIPSLIIQTQGERYAIPQVNLLELVRVPAEQVKSRVEKIGSALVMRLRGELLPLIHLADALEIKTRTFIDSATGDTKEEKRESIVDRRLHESHEKKEAKDEKYQREQDSDRRTNPHSAYNILVLSSGDHNYGLIVDRLLDSEEIVVKPLGMHLRGCNVYAGATIQGDGAVALILDVVGLSSTMNLSTVSESVKAQSNLLYDDKNKLKDSQSLLIVRNGEDEQMAIPLTLISRIERIKSSDIAITGGRRNIHYRNTSLPLFSIEEVANVSYRDETKELCYVIVFTICDREVGVLMGDIIDIIETSALIDDTTHKQPGVIGSLIIEEQITLLIDLYGIVSTIMPEWAVSAQEISYDEEGSESGRNILIVEDSLFFLNQIKMFMEEAGYIAYTAEDGLLALEVLNEEAIDLIITDIEMPNMDGLELTREIRKQEQFAGMPIIAVTSVAGEEAEDAGKLAGIDDYLIKLDREKIINQVNHYLQN